MEYIILIVIVFIIGSIFLNLYISYRKSIKKAYNRLEKGESIVVETSIGKVEYYVHKGKGIPVLIVHGISGGYDQAIQTGLDLVGEQKTLIGVSRFGYLKSDLPKEATPKNQSHVYAELLDKLEIKQVYLLATSAGGTTALKFALLYPEKVKGVILVGSGTPSKEPVKGPAGPPRFIYNDFIFWTLINKMESSLISMFGITKEEFEKSSEKEKENIRKLFKLLLPIEPRRPGIFNDEKITNFDSIKNYEEYPLEELEMPFLILHAKNDPLAKYEQIKEMVKRLKKVEFIEFEKGGHMIFGHGEKCKEFVNGFIKKHSECYCQ